MSNRSTQNVVRTYPGETSSGSFEIRKGRRSWQNPKETASVLAFVLPQDSSVQGAKRSEERHEDARGNILSQCLGVVFPVSTLPAEPGGALGWFSVRSYGTVRAQRRRAEWAQKRSGKTELIGRHSHRMNRSVGPNVQRRPTRHRRARQYPRSTCQTASAPIGHRSGRPVQAEDIHVCVLEIFTFAHSRYFGCHSRYIGSRLDIFLLWRLEIYCLWRQAVLFYLTHDVKFLRSRYIILLHSDIVGPSLEIYAFDLFYKRNSICTHLSPPIPSLLKYKLSCHLGAPCTQGSPPRALAWGLRLAGRRLLMVRRVQVQ